MPNDNSYGVLWLDCDHPVFIQAGFLELVEREIKEYRRTRQDRLIRLRLRCGAPAGIFAGNIYGFSLSTPETRAEAERLNDLYGNEQE